MWNLLWKRNVELQHVRVFTDGAIRPGAGVSGLAAIVRDERWAIRLWWSQRAGRMSCNEAEYAAAIMALDKLRQWQPRKVDVYSDSRLLVDQMGGRATARSLTMRSAHVRLRTMAAEFERVTFHHIPREQNRVADALANEAAEGLYS
jgi:ribonuclease HI